MNIATIVIGVIAIILAALAIDPATLGPRLIAYGTLLATILGYLLWPLIILLGGVVSLLSRRLAYYLGDLARTATDNLVNGLIDKRIKAYKNDLANIDQTTIAEMLVRSPAQMETLAGHLGIGKATTGIDSVDVRLSQLEAYRDHTKTLAQRIEDIEQTVASAAIDNMEMGHSVRKTFSLMQAHLRLADEYEALARDLNGLMAVADTTTFQWESWDNARENWKGDFSIWVSHFPRDSRFDEVRAVLDVDAANIRLAASQLAVIPEGTAIQQHDFREMAAINENFRRRAWTAVLRLREMSSVPMLN